MVEIVDVLGFVFKEKGYHISKQISDNYLRFTNGKKKATVFIGSEIVIVSFRNNYQMGGMIIINFCDPDSISRLHSLIDNS